MKTILLLSDDLIDSSRLTGPARDAGAAVRVVRDAATMLKVAQEIQPALIILDLANSSLTIHEFMSGVAQLKDRPRVIAFGAHVDVARLEAAKAAGCDFVMPRSAFARSVETDLANWLTTSD